MNIWGERSDLQLPCKDCDKRFPACQDTCADPAYLEAKRLREMQKAERQRRVDADRYDRQSCFRRGRKK